jgi:hypothetical protein
LRLNSMAAKMPAGPPPTITTSYLLLIPVSEPDSTSRAIPCQTRIIRNEADDRPRSITFLPRNGITLSTIAESGLNYEGTPSYADNCRVIDNTIVSFGKSFTWSRGIELHNVNYVTVKGNYVDSRNNPGSSQGITEAFSQMCKCPSCGWLFGHDWTTGLPCDKRTCPNCGSPLQADSSQNRPDSNTIRSNTITSVITAINFVGCCSSLSSFE